MSRLQAAYGDAGVELLLGHEGTIAPYYGAVAKDESDPATQLRTGPVPINIILGLLHERQIGGCTNGDTVNMIEHMTPGQNFSCGASASSYAYDVCFPALRQQHPDLFAEPLPADGNLVAFYAAMVEKYGKTVEVKSIAKPIA